MTDYKSLIYEVKDAIATLTLNRPERLNALGGTLRDDVCIRAAANGQAYGLWSAGRTSTGLESLLIGEALVRFALLKIFRFPAPFGELMIYVVLPQALYNGFIGAALVFALAWSDSIKERAS